MTMPNNYLQQPKSERPQDDIPDERVLLHIIEDYRRLLHIVDEDKILIKELKRTIEKYEEKIKRQDERIKKKDKIIAEANIEAMASVISSQKYVHMKMLINKYRNLNKELRGKLNEQRTQNLKLQENLSSLCDAIQK